MFHLLSAAAMWAALEEGLGSTRGGDIHFLWCFVSAGADMDWEEGSLLPCQPQVEGPIDWPRQRQAFIGIPPSLEFQEGYSPSH